MAGSHMSCDVIQLILSTVMMSHCGRSDSVETSFTPFHSIYFIFIFIPYDPSSLWPVY